MARTPSPAVPLLSQALESLDLASIRPHPRNDGRHPVEELAHLRQSIREHGIYRNVVVAQDGTILAGHGVVEAALAEGMTHIPGLRMSYAPDDPRALKLLVGDNHIAGLRIEDDAMLAALLQELAAEDPLALLGTGFDSESLATLLVQTSSSLVDVSASAPDTFPEYNEHIPIEHTCPKCGYEWSGGT